MGGVVERRTLADPSLEEARGIVIHTYLRLALAVPGTFADRRQNATVVRGPEGLGFCNFAIGLNFDDDAGPGLDALVAEARSKRAFNIFAMTGDRPTDLRQELEARGLAVRQWLVTMHCAGTESVTAIPTVQAVQASVRREVADFMVRQFFHQASEAVQGTLAQATAGSDLELRYIEDRSGIAAAYMLAPGRTGFGLYNLCVRSDRRGQGLGASLAQQVAGQLAAKGMRTYLQCEESLVSWYEPLGFKPLGEVVALAFAGTKQDDILLHRSRSTDR